MSDTSPERVSRYAEACDPWECFVAEDGCTSVRSRTAGEIARAAMAVADDEQADLIRERDDALAEVEVERGNADHAHAHVMDWRRRAEAAEARLDKVAALADEWEAWSPGNVPAPPATAAAYERGIRACAESLRAVLAPAPAAGAAPDSGPDVAEEGK